MMQVDQLRALRRKILRIQRIGGKFPEARIALLLQKRDPALLVAILKELESGT